MNFKQNLTILFYLVRSKKSKDGRIPIYVRVTIDGLDDDFSSGCKVLDKDWNSKEWVLTTDAVHKQKNKTLGQKIRARFNLYDSYGNILQQQKDSDVYQSIIRDYRSTLPIAIVSNAAVADIAYTSFEADGVGNWTGIIPANITTGLR